MAVLSRAKLNKARHKQAWFSEQNKEKKIKSEEPISEEEHRARLEKLSFLGIFKKKEEENDNKNECNS